MCNWCMCLAEEKCRMMEFEKRKGNCGAREAFAGSFDAHPTTIEACVPIANEQSGGIFLSNKTYDDICT